MALPATDVHELRPPPLEHDFLHLTQQAARAKCVFRVWDENSAVKLHWSGLPPTSGFQSQNSNLGSLTAESYMKVYKDFRGSVELTEGPYMKQTVVDHILKKTRHTALYYPGMVLAQDGVDIPIDELSPWISTTKSLFWAIWSIARKLAVASAPPRDIDPDDPNGLDPAKKDATMRARREHVVNLTIIRHHSGTIGLSDARRNHLELHIDPKGPTARVVKSNMSVSIQGDYEQARRLARASEEILYFGRIFAENIDSNVEFTIYRTPFELPPTFFDHSPNSRPHSPVSTSSEELHGWLSDLCWNPIEDDFDTALRKIDWRRQQLGLPPGWANISKSVTNLTTVVDPWHGNNGRGRGRGGYRGTSVGGYGTRW